MGKQLPLLWCIVRYPRTVQNCTTSDSRPSGCAFGHDDRPTQPTRRCQCGSQRRCNELQVVREPVYNEELTAPSGRL